MVWLGCDWSGETAFAKFDFHSQDSRATAGQRRMGAQASHLASGRDRLICCEQLNHHQFNQLSMCCKFFLLLHRYGSPFHHHLSLLQLPPLSCAMSRSILQLFWSATGSFVAFSTLGLF